MRGHITKRGKNSYTIVLSMGNDPVTGKRRQQWVSVKGTKKDAERRLAELVHQIDNGGFVRPNKVTVREFLERWINDCVRPNVSKKTLYGYSDIVHGRLIPELGSIPLTDLRPEPIQTLYAKWMESGRLDGKGALSARSVQRYHQCLHRALKTAMEWGLISRNPTDAVRPPKVQSREMRTLDDHGIRTVLEAANGTAYYSLFYLALSSGMRRSELLALRWCDVDLLLGQVSVSRSLHHLRDGSTDIRTPKTAKGRRTIALPPSAALVLRNHKEKQEAVCETMGKSMQAADLIFCHPEDASPLLPDTVTRTWIKLARRNGLTGVRLHDLRHTHASMMLKQGIHPKIVQERLGHASIGITLDTYSHVAPGLQAAAAARFDEGLRATLNTGVEKQAVRSEC